MAILATSTNELTQAGFSRRLRCRVSAMAGLLAVFLNLIAAIVLPVVGTVSAFDVASAGNGPIPICSVYGLRWVDADGVPVSPPVDSHHAGSCAFCLPLASAGVTPPDVVGTLDIRPAETTVAFFYPSGPSVAAVDGNPSARPRAPPAIG